MSSDIIIVSGLPRSGTSLMMQMLDHGGIEVVTDNVRAADTDNPRGYYEYEQVKKIKEEHESSLSEQASDAMAKLAKSDESEVQRIAREYVRKTSG